MSLGDRLRKYARDLETLPGDVRLLYRRGGWPEVRQSLGDRSISRLIRAGRMLVMAQELDQVRAVPPPPGVSIRRLTDGDWPALATSIPQRDIDRFRRLTARGHTCLIAWRGAQAVGYTWYSDHVGPEVTMFPIPLPRTAAYLWDLYVAPAERGNGLGSALVTARLRLAQEAGFAEGWRIVAPTNHASLRTVDKTGGKGRVVAEIAFLKLGPRLFTRYRPR